MKQRSKFRNFVHRGPIEWLDALRHPLQGIELETSDARERLTESPARNRKATRAVPSATVGEAGLKERSKALWTSPYIAEYHRSNNPLLCTFARLSALGRSRRN